jgi:hypothetical protein
VSKSGDAAVSRTKKSDAATVDHCVQVVDVGIGGVQPDQRRQGPVIELLAIIGGVQQFAVQVAVDDARRDPPDFADMFPEDIQPRLFGEKLRDDDDGDENGSCDQAGNTEDQGIDTPLGTNGTGQRYVFLHGALMVIGLGMRPIQATLPRQP